MKSKYFKIYELVSDKVYTIYGERAWQFFDHRLIETIDYIKELFKVPITINDWEWRGNFKQRGLRENTCQIVKDKTNNNITYLSAHVLGMAVDFDVKGYTAEQVRQKIIEVQDQLPHPIRLEKNVSWIHLDVMIDKIEKGKRVYIF